MTTSPTVGGDLLRLITAGMYDSPLSLYREYLQNAADAIAAQGSGTVHVMIDRIRSQIAIRDDGTGLSPREAARRLIDVGRSGKAARTSDRGFRGIGRLSALAFAEQVQFTTRTCATEPVTEVTWSGGTLRDPDLAQVDVKTAIERCTTIRQILHGDWPERFFDVSIDRIHRHAASALLNEDDVKGYIGEVCPVPMAGAFPLASKIREFLATHTDYFVLDVRVNGSDSPIKRPFGKTIPLTDKYSAAFERLEKHVIPAIDGNKPAAVVWLAHTPYAGSIPRGVGVRGLRARAGNIQIGSDRIFAHLFLEPRFNGWCVGEVHILDKRIVPNGRRDYFEPSPHQRNLENHIGAIAHEISSRCRRASSQRNRLRHVGTTINRLRRARDFAVSGYLHPDDAIALVERERKRIPETKQILTTLGAATSTSDREELTRYESQLDTIEVNPESALNGVPPDSVATIQAAFGAIAEAMPPDAAYDMVEKILRRLSR